uniref:Reverse transcriptase domain-containing protein n=1 Tax=Tanacetum cinerariifolium TaxID=118510 RepID=A0A6L2JME6_TANCI|nr:reverse transcriptase domain-containing protein [Tanacetum cinerariifolium]
MQVEKLKSVNESLNLSAEELSKARALAEVTLREIDKLISNQCKKMRLLEEQYEPFYEVADKVCIVFACTIYLARFIFIATSLRYLSAKCWLDVHWSLNNTRLLFKRHLEGTEGVVGLSCWVEKMESVFYIIGCAVKNQVKFATCTMLDAALTWWNGHVRTLGHDDAYAMIWDTFKKRLTDKYCPKGKIKKLEIEL